MKSNEDLEQTDGYLFLKETAKEYIEKYDKRIKKFLDEFEADEMDYIKKEMDYFENTLYDVQNSEGSHDGYSVTGYDNFSLAYELVTNIGYDRFMYSTNSKLKFLENQIVVNSGNQNQHNNNNEHQNDINTSNSSEKQTPASETKSTLTNHDKILKELQIIETIFHSQMNPDFHLGSGMGLPRYCNEIFIISDIEILKISDYKREYTSRIEQSKNISLVINELKTIYKKSIELYNYFATNLYHHPDKKEFFVGEDAGQQIINSTGYYYFMNYKASFGFFEIEQDSKSMNSINSKFFKNGFRYHYKNENLVLFCVKLIEFINLSEILVENQKIPTNPKENKKPKAKTLQQFFKVNVGNQIIETIQSKYKEYDGKKMAYLIYVLHKDFEIIAYSPNNRTESRKHFVDALIGKDSKKIMSGINKLFNTNDVTLNVSDYLKDNDYTSIKNDIQRILEPIK